MRRLVQHSDKNLAFRFHAYLNQNGIESTLREQNENSDSLAEIWVYDDHLIEQATQEWEQFKQDDKAQKYLNAENDFVKAKQRQIVEAKFAKVAKTTKEFADSSSPRLNQGIIIFCIAVWLLSLITPFRGSLNLLLISEYIAPRFLEIQRGQIWRLVSPIFIHGDIWHLLFNMIWLFSLGRQLEVHGGRIFYIFFVVSTAVISNIAEYYLTGPLFGGMSGVIYAMLAYVFLMERLDPNSPYEMDSLTMGIMLVWLGLGMTGSFGKIANGTHFAGLVAGGAFAFMQYSLGKNRRNS